MKRLNLFLNEIDTEKLIKISVIVLCIYFCREYFYKGVIKFIIKPFGIDQISQSIDLNIFAVLIAIGCFGRITWIYFKKKQKLCPNSYVTVFLLTICYLAVIRFTKVIVLEPAISNLKYLDAVFLAFLLLISKFRYSNPEIDFSSINGFTEDDFTPGENIDILHRENYARQIAVKILDSQPLKKAFVIAINSPWGYGKTAFLRLIETFFALKDKTEIEKEITTLTKIYNENEVEHLIRNHQNTIIVKYNPWKNFDDKKLLKDFFDELSKSIKKYSSNLSVQIKQYGDYLCKLDDSIFRKIIEITVDNFKTPNSLTSLFEEINESLGRIKKRIIVFIDDLDRLTGDEIIDVLKLIRNTANFKNTFFIVAYDHNYILNTLDKKNAISNKEDFLQKIVQLEVVLPGFRKDALIEFLNMELGKYAIFRQDLYSINQVIYEISSINVAKRNYANADNADTKENKELNRNSAGTDNTLFFCVIQNIRDVVRLVNSFKLSFEAIGSYGDFYEILLVEFLKIKFLSIYYLIANKKFLFLKGNLYEFDYVEYEKFLIVDTAKGLNIKENDIEVVRTILQSLFSPKRKIFFRSVKYPRYFDIYFTYQTATFVSLENIERALKLGIDEIIQVIEKSINENTFNDLLNFFLSQEDFGNKEDFEIILKTLFYLVKYDSENSNIALFKIRGILRDKKIQSYYLNSEQSLADFLISVLSDSKFDFTGRAEIAGDELYKIVNRVEKNENIVILVDNKIALQKILADCLEKAMEDIDNLKSGIIFKIYLKNLEDIAVSTRRIIISKDANNKMKKFIQLHPYEYFKNNLLRQHPEPSFDGQYYYFDPFLLDYFDSKWNLFISYFKSPEISALFLHEPEKEFYNFLIEALQQWENNKGEKFLVQNKEAISLIDKFILPVYRTRLGDS